MIPHFCSSFQSIQFIAIYLLVPGKPLVSTSHPGGSQEKVPNLFFACLQDEFVKVSSTKYFRLLTVEENLLFYFEVDHFLLVLSVHCFLQ